MKKLPFIIITILVTLFFSTLNASNLDYNNSKVLKVGTKYSPPFSMQSPDGKWEGISIELWQEIAKKLNLKYEFKKENLASLLKGVEDKRLDIGISALTITADREAKLDFSHTYYTSWLGIAVPKKEQSTAMIILHSILSLKMLAILVMMFITLIVVGALIWLSEKKKNPDVFSPNPLKGIGNAIWWAATTMTTVGYGDVTPKTVAGRSIAIVWMIISLLAASSIIATVSSALTVSKLDGPITSQKDLARGKIATIKYSTSDKYLKNRRVYPIYYKDIPSAIRALERKEVDAVVYDKPILNYYLAKEPKQKLTLLDCKFQSQNYSIALPEGNVELLEKINRALLEIVQSAKWEEILHKYRDNRF